MSIRVLGSDDKFVKDKFYCTGKDAIGEFRVDFPDIESAHNCADDLKKHFPETDYKVIEEFTELTKHKIDSLWYNPEFISKRELEDELCDDRQDYQFIR